MKPIVQPLQLKRKPVFSVGLLCAFALAVFTVGGPLVTKAQADNGIRFSDVIPRGLSKKFSSLGDISLWRNDMQKAKRAYRKGSYVRSRKYFRKALKGGNFLAAWYLGHIHRLGLGVPADRGKAFYYYRLVALQYNGQIKNPRVFRITVDALVRVANGYRTGIKSGKVARDYHRAMRLFLTASNAGHPGAQYGLGLMYLGGKGVKKNPSKGIRWVNLAARKNYPPALALLGDYFWRGKYLKKSQSRALMMYMVAAQNSNEVNNPKLFDRLDYLSNKASSDDVLLAERLTQVWYERHPRQKARHKQIAGPPPQGPQGGSIKTRKAFTPQ